MQIIFKKLIIGFAFIILSIIFVPLLLLASYHQEKLLENLDGESRAQYARLTSRLG